MTSKRKTADDLRREGVRLAIKVASIERDRLYEKIFATDTPAEVRVLRKEKYRAVCATIVLMARALEGGVL